MSEIEDAISEIEDAIKEAEAAAQNQTPAVVQQSSAPALAQPAGAPINMGATAFLKSGGMQPDYWVDIKDTGFKIVKTEKAVFDSIDVEIDFSAVKPFQGLRVKMPDGKPKYIKTYDGVTESRSGKPWATAVAELQGLAVEPADQYRGFDIPMILSEDVKQGATTIEAGKKVGYTTPVTGFAVAQAFLEKLVNDGDVTIVDDNFSGVVKTRVSHLEKSNASYTWAVLDFEKID